MPAAAILDVDGTLVDTNYQHAIAWYRAFRGNGIVLPVWRIHRHIGMGGDHLVEALTSEEVEVAVEKSGTDSAVMVGDSTFDCEAAKRAGLETVAVLTGGFSEQELMDAGAKCAFTSIEELRGSLDETPLKL